MTEILNIPVRIPRAPRGSLNEAQQYALNNNLVHYQGNPCNKNHSGLRYTKNGCCVECRKWKPTGGKAGGIPNPFRAKALENGDKYYYTGKPCRTHGHMSKRLTSNSRCEECHEIYMKEVRKHRERKYGLAKYKITEADYDGMLREQNYVCAICKQPEKIKDHNTKKLKLLAVDHCHDTNKVRGLLCTNCNIGIGNLKHDPILIRAAALYCEIV